MTSRLLPINNPTHAQPVSLIKHTVDSSCLFVASLLNPLVNMCQGTQDLYKRQICDMATQGLARYTWTKMQDVGCTIKEHPFDALTLILRCPGVENREVLIQIINSLKNAKFSKELADSTNAFTLVGKTVKIISYGALIYSISAIPASAALEWNSLTDAKAFYSGEETCPADPWDRLFNPSMECIKEGKSLSQCLPESAPEIDTDLYVFTRHPSSNPNLDPVSILQFGQKTCFYTALDKTSAVTKLCFENLGDLNSRVLEVIPGMSLQRAHEGLNPGQNVIHLGMQLKNNPQNGCGFFKPSSTITNPGQSAVCILTSIESGKAVSQVCFDSNRPETMTLKEAKGVKLKQPNSKEPISIVIEKPREVGLDIDPDTQASANIPCPNKPEQGISLWDALTWWWTQKTPCDTKDGAGRREL